MSASTHDDPIRVLVADDDDGLRAMLGALISDEPSLELVATASNARDAVAQAARLKPDVALVDVRMPAGGGIRAARGVREVSPRTAVVALSGDDDRASVVGMVEAGAVSYLVKGRPVAELIDGVRLAARRESTLSPGAANHVLEELSRQLQLDRQMATARGRQLARIDRAVAGDGLRIVFQPIFDLLSRRPFAYEALARFTGPPEQPPNQWFAEAAEAGRLVDLELRAVRMAINAFAKHRPDALLTVNVSPETLASPALIAALELLPRGQIVLEITEHAPVADYEATAEHVQQLRARGAWLAVDDAGAGFASLAHVLRLEPDLIKLDMSLTRAADRQPSVRALSSALVGFAHDTNATIIAEGIETPSELRTLQGLGIIAGQGYLLGRPGDLTARPASPPPLGSLTGSSPLVHVDDGPIAAGRPASLDADTVG